LNKKVKLYAILKPGIYMPSITLNVMPTKKQQQQLRTINLI